ncbi:MAG: ASCH domain-containing protein [Salinivirgaceae bacterium]|nr:ASCH domain-containing protein [Salinivirgaceae bacterium]
MEDEEKNDDDDEAPTKENTLYLVIKQVYFDQIVEGVKKEEFREIKDTTYKKYLQFFDDGTFNYNPNVIDENDPLLGDILIWNNGDYPYLPINYKYLSLAVGYNKERDTALVKVEDISFTPMLDKKGNPARLHDDCNGGINLDSNGELCFWQVVYHLGQVIEINRAK